ncbi:carboxymuconolactone decarboxylase family protein [Halobiforma nitratireducens]|uniref:Carboxymuconolactone decarboxylase n=1 Tax=Halobiforma nitratireducens JCM 10879 TaxID=1227454 RepID=M0LJI5_9EURY|nr:carboxymuconolactone decarboxylase family protein [Halobiforma nitratireducens]EMA33228.1 carboxymuconolactone decarboxylase [Halobiforma nitratireducens JCM 10879]
MADEVDDTDELPSTAGEFADEYPDVWEQYADLGEACAASGPIDGESKRLVKLGLAVAAQSEGAVHSHVRRALDEDVSPEALRQVAILSIPTVGFPQAMAALSWIDDLVDGDDGDEDW